MPITIPDRDRDPRPDPLPSKPGTPPPPAEDQWMEWWQDGSGHWHTDWHPGKPPKGAYRRGDGWVWPGSPHNQTATKSSSSSTSTKKDSDPNNTKPPPRNGRPPYMQPERYFDAVQNRWRWRWRYIATNAEVIARRQGLAHDARGYYRVRNGRRVYQTGRTPSGRRFHYETRDGRRERVFDDPYAWPGEFNKRRQRLADRKVELKSRLESLRDQYRNARSDQHVLRRNIMRRMRQVEANLHRVEAALKRLPSSKPFMLDFSKAKPKLKGGIRITLDFAIDPKDPKDPLAFTTRSGIGPNALVWMRASISIEDRDWKPGMLGAPEMLRVHWTRPKGWLEMGQFGHWGSDEYLVSNPLMLVRPYRAPTTGDRTPRFTVRAKLYEYSFDVNTNAHREAEP